MEELVNIQEKLRKFKEEHYQNIDRKMVWFLLSYFLFGLLLTQIYDSLRISIFLGGSVLITYLLSMKYVNTEVRRYIVSLSFAAYVIQFMIQMQGVYYFQFLFFITLSLLVFYQNWKVLIPYSLILGLYCFLMYVGIINGLEDLKVYFLNIDTFNPQLALFSSILGGSHLALCIFLAIYLERKSEKESRNIIYLRDQLNIEANTRLANQIAEGILDQEFKPKDNDLIGQSLLNMRNSLKVFVESERRHKWSNMGIAKISQILMAQDTLETLCDAVLIAIVEYVNGLRGILYLSETINVEGNDKVRLNPLSFYACTIKNAEEEIFLGEGLVGQVATQLSPLYLQEVPDSYFEIQSATGKGKPTSLLLLPLTVKGQLVGVIEMAFFRRLNEYEIEFLTEISERVSATILTVRSFEQNEKLLKEAQEYASRIEKEEFERKKYLERLQQTQKELSEKNHESERIKMELSAQWQALNLSTIIVELDLEGDFLKVNERFCHISGYASDDLLGLTFKTILHPEDVKVFYEKLQTNLTKGRLLQVEIRILSTMGETVWVDFSMAPVFDEHQQITKYLFIGVDITNRVQQANQVQELAIKLEEEHKEMVHTNTLFNEQLRAINSSLAMLEIDLDRTIRNANNNYLKISGYSLNEIINMPVMQMFADAFTISDEYLSLWEKLDAGETFEGEFQFSNADKQLLWLRGSFSGIVDEKGHLVHYLLLCYDITSEKMHQEEIRDALDQLKAQEEEMQMGMEELEAMQETIQAESDALQSYKEALEAVLPVAELSEDGLVIRTNNNFQKLLKCSGSKLQNTDLSQYFQLKDSSLFAFKQGSSSRNEEKRAPYILTHSQQKGTLFVYRITDPFDEEKKKKILVVCMPDLSSTIAE